MASGFGLNGEIGKCFPMFQDFVACMHKSDDPYNECPVFRDDYMYCLRPNRNQEVKRIMVINQEEMDQVKRGEQVLEPAFIDRYGVVPTIVQPRGDRIKVPYDKHLKWTK
mmetsp:Transcript_107768/g.232049  ORF Transcript_107768/g.232049 Transcript_107768/m.232049 type:complete len:110 (+) Transcript_107768:39-368(+)